MATHALASSPFERVSYRRIVVPIAGDDESETGVALAAELAPEAGASITAVFVIEVAAELPLDAHMHDEEHAAREALEKAHAIAAEAEAVQADLVVMRAAPKNGKRLFGRTADYVLRHAYCRVLVTAPGP